MSVRIYTLLHLVMRCWLVATIICCPAHGRQSISYSTLNVVEMIESVGKAEDIAAETVKDLRSVMTDEESEIVRNIEFRVTPSENVQDVGSEFKDGKRFVYITLGYLSVNLQLTEAQILAWNLTMFDRLDGYHTSLVWDSLLDEQLRAKGSSRLPPFTFTRYLGYSQEEGSNLRRQEPIRSLLIAATYNSFAVIIGHEIGHNILGHAMTREEFQQKTTEQLFQQELEADNFALNLIDRLGEKDSMYQPEAAMVGYSAMLFRGMLDPNSRDSMLKRAVRTAQQVSAHIDQRRKDPVFQADLARSGKAQEYNEMADLVKAYENCLRQKQVPVPQTHVSSPQVVPGEKLVFRASGFSIDALEIDPTKNPSGPYNILSMTLPPSAGSELGVTVQIQPRIYSVRDLLDLTKLQLKAYQMTILKEEAGASSALIECSGIMGPFLLHLYQRAEYADRWIYIITAKAPEQQWPVVGDSLKACVDSFRLGTGESNQNTEVSASTPATQAAPGHQ